MEPTSGVHYWGEKAQNGNLRSVVSSATAPAQARSTETLGT